MLKETLYAPCSGLISQIYTPSGSLVNEGDEILSIEVMKLFMPVVSSLNGKIKLIVSEGEFVQENQELGEILE
jgi:biotin carboxyl carrier protein